jgi:hypothetical protein
MKPLAQYRKILRHAIEPFKMCKRYFVRQNLSFPSAVHPAFHVYDSAGRIARDLWWKNEDFSSVDIIPP